MADLTEENLARNLRVIPNEAVDWDDRKHLAEIWQEHTPLPDEGLSAAVYSALIAVARWGAEQAAEILSED